MADKMGVQLLTEEDYRALQQLGEFDLKTSSWLRTPPGIRDLGGAIFGDRRFDQVFVYHNGAESYYGGAGSGQSSECSCAPEEPAWSHVVPQCTR